MVYELKKNIFNIYEQAANCNFFFFLQNEFETNELTGQNIESRPHENVRYFLKITAVCIDIFYIQTYRRV